MEKIKDEELREREINFLEEEFKKINDRIKEVKYSNEEALVSQKILWALRGIIWEELIKFLDIKLVEVTYKEKKIP